MENKSPDDLTFCDKNCKLVDAFDEMRTDISRMRKAQERNEEGFAKFEKKQDQILDVLSDYKVLLNEIKNLKSSQEKLEEQFIRESSGNRENSIEVFKRLNELEKSKADKEDLKEGKGWIWGLIIMALSVAANFIFDLFKGHLTGK